MNPPSLTSPGLGISWIQGLDPLLLTQRELVDWVEFEPQTTWLVAEPEAEERASYDLIEHVLQLPGRKLVHSVAAPVGGSSEASAHHLNLLRKTVGVLNAPWASEHLGFNASHGVCTGFFLPPRQTEAQVRIVADNIRRLQDALGVPVAIENIASYLRPRSDEMSDGEFLARVLEAADCGLLLDLHNAYTNARNGRQALEPFLNDLPLERVWEIHLAGGLLQDGFWLDAHSGPVPKELWPLIRDLPDRLPSLKVVNLELYPAFLETHGLEVVVDELRRIRSWISRSSAAEAVALPAVQPSAPLTLRDQRGQPPLTDLGDPWEAALTALVTGKEVLTASPETADLQAHLADERGVPLVREMVFSFRASMVVQVLKLSARLLLRAVGPGVCRQMLSDAFAHHPPALYATLEALSFAEHVKSRDWQIPLLEDVLGYELAVAQTLIDGKPRVVTFPVEPIPLLRALMEGRIPEADLLRGTYEIEIQPDPNRLLI
ncbi:MAG: hypothetical protein RLZZ117_1624 [Cyanobacteriota bacterium]